MNRVRLRPTGRLIAVLAAASLIVAACGDDDDDETSASATTAPTATTEAEGVTTTTEEPEEEEPAEGQTVEVTAVDYGYEGLPEQVDAGTKLSLANDSTAELHELVVFALPETEQRSVDELLALPEEELGALFAGPPALVILSPPGSSADAAIPAVGDGTITDPGRYLVFCTIPTGADPAAFLAGAQAGGDGAPDVPGGPPHFTQGMFAELNVE